MILKLDVDLNFRVATFLCAFTTQLTVQPQNNMTMHRESLMVVRRKCRHMFIELYQRPSHLISTLIVLPAAKRFLGIGQQLISRSRHSAPKVAHAARIGILNQLQG